MFFLFVMGEVIFSFFDACVKPLIDQKWRKKRRQFDLAALSFSSLSACSFRGASTPSQSRPKTTASSFVTCINAHNVNLTSEFYDGFFCLVR